MFLPVTCVCAHPTSQFFPFVLFVKNKLLILTECCFNFCFDDYVNVKGDIS